MMMLLTFLINLKSAWSSPSSNELRFYEEPTDAYVTRTQPAILKCKIENARSGFFKCNDHWTQHPTSSRIIQVSLK
jgi:hypothetical protein